MSNEIVQIPQPAVDPNLSLAVADRYREFTTTLPSVVAAERFLRGEKGGLMAVVSSTLGRAGIIFMGLYLVGERKHTLKYALAGAVAIETFVLLRIKNQLEKAKKEAEAAALEARRLAEQAQRAALEAQQSVVDVMPSATALPIVNS